MQSASKVTIALAALALAGVDARGEPFPVQAVHMCANGFVFDVPDDVCPAEPNVVVDLCLDAQPAECCFTHMNGGIGLTLWNVTGTAIVQAASLNSGQPTSFMVSGSYDWVVRPQGPDLQWSIEPLWPYPPVPAIRMTGFNAGFGAIGLRIVGGGGLIQLNQNVDDDLQHAEGNLQQLGGNLQLEFSEMRNSTAMEGAGFILTSNASVLGTVVSNPGLDSDNDAVADGFDNARCNSNPDQADLDGDGLGDIIDLCPQDPTNQCTTLSDSGAEGLRRTLWIRAHTNPASATVLDFNLPAAASAAIRIFDVAGRLVYEFPRNTYGAGSNQVTWRGADRSGNALPAGMYIARLETDRGLAMTRMVKLGSARR